MADMQQIKDSSRVENILLPGTNLSAIPVKTDAVPMTTSNYKVQVLTTEQELEALASEWDELVAESDQRVFFLHWIWNRQWWRLFSPPGAERMVIICRDGNDQLVGLAPFYRKIHRFIGIPHLRKVQFFGTGIEMSTSEYLDIISRSGYEQVVAEAVVSYLNTNKNWDLLQLRGIPAASSLLPHFLRALGPGAQTSVCGHAIYVDTTQDYETIKARWGKKFRTNLVRFTNRLSQLPGFEFRRVTNTEEFNQAMAALIRLHQARWNSKGEPGSFSTNVFEVFLHEIGIASIEDDRLRFWTLSIEGKIVATLIAFYDNRIVHYFQGGFDPAYAKESLGSVMINLCIQDCVASDNVDAFDFMEGGVEYKKHWSETGRDLIELQVQRNTLQSVPYRFFMQAREILGPSIRPLKRQILRLLTCLWSSSITGLIDLADYDCLFA
jgi:CelD/BcsL family acetyltransferase involved in cellulose biosynthesis